MKAISALRRQIDTAKKAMLHIIASCVFLIAVVSVCQAESMPSESGSIPVPSASRVLVFGVYAHVRAIEMFKKMEPFRKRLEAALVKKDVPVTVSLKINPTYDAAIDGLVSGKLDFARVGPVSYVIAKAKNPNIELLAMENKNGQKRFNGVVFVHEDSPVKSLSQLKGKTVAFGNKKSTTGRFLAQAALVNAGVKAGDLSGYDYLGRHDKVAFAVSMGIYDAGASNENTYHKYSGDKRLRKIAEFPCVTKPWVAREGLDKATIDALQAVLLEFEEEAALKSIKRSGFFPAIDADYDLIREGIRLAGEFEYKPSISNSHIPATAENPLLN
jgi:phosphonate transport system substrate-binding protein